MPGTSASIVSLNPKIDVIGGRPAAGLVTLRPATPADLNLLRRWDQDPQLRVARGDDDWQWESELRKNLPWREQLIAELDGRPIGYLEIIDPEQDVDKYWGCMDAGHRAIDVWIGEPDARGRGYGSRMMRLAIERCFADPSVHTILIDPLETNTRAQRFYERLGFEYVACRDFHGDRCLVYKLRRDGTRPAN